MRRSDLTRILEIERSSFVSPWTRENFEHELENTRVGVNRVLIDGEELLGYACFWTLLEELKINNFAIAPTHRGKGLGRLFLTVLLEEGVRRGNRIASLEVRPSNVAAVRLYTALGFREIGRRPGYYQAEKEDGLVMEKELG